MGLFSKTSIDQKILGKYTFQEIVTLRKETAYSEELKYPKRTLADRRRGFWSYRILSAGEYWALADSRLRSHRPQPSGKDRVIKDSRLQDWGETNADPQKNAEL